jgi:hypothetical protein
MESLSRMTVEVSEGRREPAALGEVLSAVLVEAESFAGQVDDDTFTDDDASRGWKQGTVEAAGALCASVYRMLRALEPLDRAALLSGLEQMLAAERAVRDVYRGAQAYNQAVREALEQAHRVPCMRCGHRNQPGRSTCEKCRMQLPQMGIERIETDIVGGETVRESVFLDRLDLLMERVDSEEGRQGVVDFLQNLERLYVVGGRQLDAMLARAPREHMAVQYTVELRKRFEGVRQMVEAVRLAVGAGQVEALHDFRPWLAEQFQTLIELKERVAAAC